MANNGSVQAAVYNALKKNIMNLQLKPGAEMSTQEIAEKLNVSRTPVREAFIRLQRDGLLDIFPQKGTFVSKIRLSRVQQERFIRESLECANMEQLTHCCKLEYMEQLETNIEKQEEAVAKSNFPALMDLDNEFHELTFYATGQILAWETILSTSNHYSRIRNITAQDNNIMKKVVLEHQEILQAIQDGSAKYAKTFMKNHLHKLEDQLSSIIKQNPDFFAQDEVSNQDRFEMLLTEN